MFARSYFLYSLLLGGILIWCGGVFIAPMTPDPSLGSLFYETYGRVCHQDPHYSFRIGGEPLAVCMRCTSIYLAFLAGTLLFPLYRPSLRTFITSRYFIVLLVAPMVVDVGLAWLTPYTPSVLSRVLTGGIFGLGAAFLVMPLFIEALMQLITGTRYHNTQ